MATKQPKVYPRPGVAYFKSMQGNWCLLSAGFVGQVGSKAPFRRRRFEGGKLD